jgi:hypothetical protein
MKTFHRTWVSLLTFSALAGGLNAADTPLANTTPAPAGNATAPTNTATAPEPLLFCYFNGNGDGLHLATSTDGVKWTPLNNDKPLLKPTVGSKLMRDPCIARGPDGIYRLVWTTGWNDNGIGYAQSTDLTHWSEQQYLPVMADEAKVHNTWAPEVFYDEANQDWLIYWSSTVPGKFPATDGQDAKGSDAGYNNRVYFVKTKDFKTFTKAAIFYDPGYNVIDATLAHDGKRFVMVYKDETNTPFTPQKNLKVAFSDKVEGPYVNSSAPFTGKDWSEGPTAIKIGDQWYVYFDKYRQHQYGLMTTKDWEHWTDLTDQLKAPPGIRHGTVLRVPATTLAALQQGKTN